TINGDVAGTGLVQNITTGALEVDPTAFNGDGNITSGDLTVGGDANALLGDVTLEIAAGAVGNTELAANAVTTDKILDGTIASADIAADAVNAATINGDVAGTGLVQNITTGALEVDPTAFNGDGNITSGDLTVGGDANALLGDVTLEIAAGAVGNTELAANAVTTDKILDGTIASADIAADAVNAATINGDVAGTGLVQNITTGALEVDPTAFNGDGNITSGDLTVGGDANALLGDVTLEIAAGAVGTAELADGAVTNIKLAANAVTTDKILDGTIASADIAADAVNAATINGDVAGTGLVQNITTGALEVDPTAFNGDGNITSGDLTVGGDANALLGDVTLEIAAGAVGTAELADGAVTNIKLAANAVTTDKILDGTIASADIAADAVNAATINGDVAGTGLVQNITTGALEVDPTAFNGDGNITSGDLTVGGDANALLGDVTLEIAAGAVGTAELADGAVTNIKLAANAVTTDKILDGTIASADIAADAVNAATINGDVAGTGLVQNITTGALEVDPTAFNGDGNITSGDLTVGGDVNALLGDVTLEIAAGAVGTAELADGAVTNIKLAANAVTTDKILDGTIASADIAADAVNAATINGDVAGTGLVQNITTGALEVDPTAFNGDGNITSGDLTVGGDANALLGDVTLEIAAGAVGNTELAANAVTTDKILDGTIASADIASGGNDKVLTTSATGVVTWEDKTALDTDATNEIQTLSKTGTTISLSNGGGSVNETVTTLTQNDVSPTGEITYTNEAGTATTAQVVSANAGNQVTAGTDGGAFFASPVKAIGKVLGTGVAAKIRNATVTRLDEGDYQITFASAMPDAHYIIQLSILDCGGDCPGNSTSNYDDPGISYYAQTTTGFRVNIGDSDNGTNQKDDIDLEFMFTVLDY
ncbi:beta strand repeat-containing protein, partial [Aquimarina sp. 2-A2]|uniref:beta strand repeat-containing protein n=1 Tax=Aquimarina sp. 2-A2 TaxID=3382644 RepID=UPI00387F250C